MRLYSFAFVAGLTSLAACSRPEFDLFMRDRAEVDVLLDPPEAGEGVQYRMAATVPPGAESYGCQLFMAPPEGLYVQREAVKFSLGGHHVLLYRTPYTSIPARDERGEAVDAAAFHDCSKGATSRWLVNGVLGGSESFSGDGLLTELPEGVAITIEPGAVLVMSTHYLNATPASLDVDARINLYTIPKEKVTVEAGVLYLDNPIVRVPAHGKSTARMRCPIPRDISIVSLQSHMHSRGVWVSAEVLGESAHEDLYKTHSWSEPDTKRFEPPLFISTGSSIELRCHYQNKEARDVGRGLTEADEMCQLIGPYYPRDEAVESCRDDDGDLAGTWIGEGSASCLETWECLQSADPHGEGGGLAYFGCVMNSCPYVAEEVSALVRCQLTRGGGACSTMCGTEGASCEACVFQECSSAIKACEKAKCCSRK